ncbi:MAG TPA: protein-methionine-sulfoxide reductase catalytic subunit MsrP, partial [Nitrospina sp.]|nr:protein-methionine-sulfoxide reductase catalytic subunit MsrP [Nitrospina sp.]
MSNLKIPSSWDLPENQATLEEIYLNRRSFLEQIGEVTVGALVLSALPGFLASAQASEAGSQNSTGGGSKKEEVPPNFQNRITPENLVTRYNNFYEFSTNKASIWHLAKKLPLEKWTLKISGQVAKPRTLDLEKLLRGISLEQRVYRLRCVETWSAIIPWTGFPLRDLIKALDPLSTARYIKFQTFLDPNAAAGQKERFWEPWPYTEGLSMTEAMHPLAFLAVGIYGHPLPPQNGAPIRLVVPWKYGFKSIKS